MSRIISMVAVACLLLAAVNAVAQGKPKAGLWEYSTQMSMAGQQMPQLPAGVTLPAGVSMPHGMGGPIVSQVCVTQDQIDKYGGPTANPHHGNCQVTNLSKQSDGMTAEMKCTGDMNATGTIVSKWSNGGNTTNTTMHMTGTMNAGGSSQPIDMTTQVNATYKGADCGSVKPLQAPAAK